MKAFRWCLYTFTLLFPISALCGVFEVGSGFSYSRSAYNAGSASSTRSWNASLGYYFTQDSQVMFSYQDTLSKDFVPNVQDLQYRDRVYSVNLVYHLLGEGSTVRPYVRAGVGQLNRDATGTFQGGFSPPGRLDQVTVIGGLGLRIRITQQVAFKAEGTSYLTGGSVSTWQDNFTVNFGGSFYF
jgi:hypothetical protein